MKNVEKKKNRFSNILLDLMCFCRCVCVLCCSRYWTSRTPTAQPTVRPHSSTRRTRGSTRRGLRPLWSRVGWMSERLRPPTLPSSPPSAPPTPVHRSLIFTSSRRRRRRRQKKQKKIEQLYQKNSSATLKKGRMKQPNHSGHIKQTCLPIRSRKTGEGDSILCLCFLFFF